MRFQYTQDTPHSTASLRELTTAAPMAADRHAAILRERQERRMRVEAARDEKEIERSCYGY